MITKRLGGSIAAIAIFALAGSALLLERESREKSRPGQAAGRRGGLESVAIEEAFPRLTFSRPVFITAPRDGSGRLFVVEQDGLIKSFRANAESTRTFLDLRALVLSPARGGGMEEGLLGLAFDPQFGSNGEFYVYYSASEPRRNVVARYRVGEDPESADITSGTVLLELPKPFSNHNGGALAFGPDGMLYISVGDGGSGGDPQGNAQNRTSLLGKILRIDPKSRAPYGIPPDNPFGNEVWAYGLRNPWRMSFDRQTGELWLGDAGQNSWEEINRVKRGTNLGWNVFEGTHEYKNPSDLPASAFTAPVWEYPNDDSGGRAVIGGYVYRGTQVSSLQGRYVFGDFVSGRIWALRPDPLSVAQVARLPSLSAFGEDEAGELYLLSYSDGKVFRFR